jgi:RNA polymerase sigma-70 factor, ECF subfamily
MRVSVGEVLKRRRAGGASLAEIEAVYRGRLAEYRRVAAAICGDRDASADVVQEAFARAVRERGGFRGEGRVDAWLWRIVVNVARNYERDRPLDRSLDPDAVSANGSGESPMSNLAAAVAGLPERQRLVLFLRYYADLDYGAISEVAGIRPGTVGATLSAARAALEQRLKRVGAGS